MHESNFYDYNENNHDENSTHKKGRQPIPLWIPPQEQQWSPPTQPISYNDPRFMLAQGTPQVYPSAGSVFQVLSQSATLGSTPIVLAPHTIPQVILPTQRSSPVILQSQLATQPIQTFPISQDKSKKVETPGSIYCTLPPEPYSWSDRWERRDGRPRPVPAGSTSIQFHPPTNNHHNSGKSQSPKSHQKGYKIENQGSGRKKNRQPKDQTPNSKYESHEINNKNSYGVARQLFKLDSDGNPIPNSESSRPKERSNKRNK